LPPLLQWKRTEKGWCLYTWTDWNLLREPLGTRGLEEGTVVAVREWSPRKGKNGDTLIGYLGWTALRREQCDGFAQRINLWSQRDPLLGKHIPNVVN
jgi:hypothetical protein